MEEKEKQIVITTKIVIGLGLAVITLWIACGLLTYYLIEENDRGTFGDMFGSVNALFSGLAFSGVIIAILLQREELKLQRDELEKTREVFESQTETLKRQQFENTFFQMVSLHNDIVNSIKIQNNNGRDGLSNFFKDVRGRVTFSGQAKAEEITTRYLDLYKSGYGSYIGHYFRNLYNIIKFVDKSDIADKKFYTNIIRAQLSVPELLLIMINCSTSLGSEKFRPLIEKYALLSNLIETEELKELKHVADNYNDRAFV